MEAVATKVSFEPGHNPPRPVWIVRSDKGFALGDKAASVFLKLPLMSPARKTALQFKQYRQRCILGSTRGTPGQLFTATITYFEGYTESALGVSIKDAAKMFDISSEVIRQLKIPAMSQVRVVHPSRALLGFTCLEPKTAVFEFGLANDSTFPLFEKNLTDRLAQAVAYTFHWSKTPGSTLTVWRQCMAPSASPNGNKRANGCSVVTRHSCGFSRTTTFLGPDFPDAVLALVEGYLEDVVAIDHPSVGPLGEWNDVGSRMLGERRITWRATLEIAAIVTSGSLNNGAVRLSWNAAIGSTYCVLATDSPDTPWSAAENLGCFIATNSLAQFDDALAASRSLRFQRGMAIRAPCG
jgi:hypothetical protein